MIVRHLQRYSWHSGFIVGVGIGFVSHLIALKRGGRVRRLERVVELGAQQLTPDLLDAPGTVGELFSVFGRPVWTPPPPSADRRMAHGVQVHLPEDSPPARPFWQALGLDYAAIDIDGSPGAIPLDLNVDAVPPDACGSFDLVTNFGTTEHVCNQFNAFRAVHDLCRLDGLMVHSLPVQGYLGHGLVNYNPKFFVRLAEANNYEVVHFQMLRDRMPYEVQDYVGSAVRAVGGDADELRGYHVVDAELRVTLRKVFDRPFLPPLDVPAGASIDNAVLRERYWPVFKPDSVQVMYEARFAAGNTAHTSGDFVAARIAWEPMAVRGHAGAQAGLAMLYLLGQGVDQDPATAVQWLTRAGEQGLADAQFLLSRLVSEGVGAPRDAAMAQWWLQRAANNGHALAQNNLAMSLLAEDCEQALQWFQRAAEAGLVDAQINVAAVHLRNLGAARDVAVTRRWLDRAAQGSSDAAVLARVATLRQELAALEGESTPSAA